MTLADDRNILIVAHPGHELLLHHWLERAKPVVFALTDGSGSSGQPRTETSKRIIGATGSRIGAVFGSHPDRFWYDQILCGNLAPFHAVADTIAGSLLGRVDTVVADPVEYFNPVHDLAAVIGHLVAGRLAADTGDATLLTYPIEQPATGSPMQCIPLDPAAVRRKHEAALSYCELQNEVGRVLARAQQPEFAIERLYRADCAMAYPATPPATPYYETFARQRVQEGRYCELITYRDHMRPLVHALLNTPVPCR